MEGVDYITWDLNWENVTACPQDQTIPADNQDAQP